MNALARRAARVACLLAALGAAGSARPDDHGPRVPMPAAYLQECGACHAPFPARALPAPSWQRLLATLPRHFGADASLDPPTTRALADWLQANAAVGNHATEPPPQDRLTRSAWFAREHGEVPAALWRAAAVGKPSNCAACHTRAAEGRFGEREIRLPR